MAGASISGVSSFTEFRVPGVPPSIELDAIQF